MDKLPDLASVTTEIRANLNITASTRRAVSIDNSLDFKATRGADAEQIHLQVKVAPRANFSLPFPELKAFDAASELAKLRGVIDFDKVVVMTGYAEVGPFGSSRTRWEMEARGSFTIQGTLELAYITGLIKHFDGRLKDGSLYVGWVDAKTAEPLDDKDVKSAYEKHILAHTGIRFVGACFPAFPFFSDLPLTLPLIRRARALQRLRSVEEGIHPGDRAAARPRAHRGLGGGRRSLQARARRQRRRLHRRRLQVLRQVHEGRKDQHPQVDRL